MERCVIHVVALAVGWLATSLILIGQTLIRTAYEWLRWAERW
jgi:hypothetical protein